MLVQVSVILLGLMVLGAVLLALGWRGKRINDHPICRDCTFDLVAVPEGTITCPECGAGLRRERAVRIGARRRRPAFLGVGAFLALVPLLPLGTLGYAAVSGQDVNAWKPLGLLLWEAERARGSGGRGVAAELLKRYGGGTLNKEQSARVVAVALKAQEDETRPWASEWGDLLEQADTKNELSKEHAKQFRRNAPVLEWKSRARVCAGDAVPVLLKLKEARIGPSSGLMSMVTLKEAKVGDKKVRRGFVTTPDVPRQLMVTNMGNQLGWFYLFGSKSRWGWNDAYGETAFLLQLPKDLPPGRHEIKIAVVSQTRPQGNNLSWGASTRVPKGEDCKEHLATLAVEVVEKADAAEKIKPTPEADSKFQLALNPQHTMIYGAGGSMHMVSQQFTLNGLPAPIAHDVIWKSGDEEWRLGTLTSGAGAAQESFFYGGDQNVRQVSGQIRGFKGKTVDVILRPNPAALAYTIDQTKIYDGEIVLTGVEVQRQDDGVTVPSLGGGLVRYFLGR